jgi:hypothetical protein
MCENLNLKYETLALGCLQHRFSLHDTTLKNKKAKGWGGGEKGKKEERRKEKEIEKEIRN